MACHAKARRSLVIRGARVIKGNKISDITSHNPIIYSPIPKGLGVRDGRD